MNGWRSFLVGGLASAVGIPVAGLLIALSSTALAAHGPAFFASTWIGRLLLGALTLAGFAIVLFSQLRYERVLVFLGAFFPLMLGLSNLQTAYEAWLLQQRAELTTCRVLEVTRHQRTTTTEHGGTSTRTWYEYDLACDHPWVTEMTTGSKVAEAEDELVVAYDPSGRLDPQPADAITDPGGSAQLGAALYCGGIMLRLLYDLGVPPFGYRDSWPGHRRHWSRGTARWRLAGWLVGRTPGLWLIQAGGLLHQLLARVVVAWLCWRLRRCQRGRPHRPALPWRPLVAVVRVMATSPDRCSSDRARDTLADLSAEWDGRQEVLSCLASTDGGPTEWSGSDLLTPSAMEFLCAPLPDRASCRHLPRVRLVGHLSAAPPGPWAGKGPDGIARWLVEAVAATGDPAVQRAGAQLLQVTNEPHLLKALERSFTDRLGRADRWRSLWDGEHPALLTHILLENPHLPPSLAGERPGNYVMYRGVLLAVLKGQLDLLPEYVRVKGRSGTVSALQHGASLPGPQDFTDACQRALRLVGPPDAGRRTAS